MNSNLSFLPLTHFVSLLSPSCAIIHLHRGLQLSPWIHTRPRSRAAYHLLHQEVLTFMSTSPCAHLCRSRMYQRPGSRQVTDQVATPLRLPSNLRRRLRSSSSSRHLLQNGNLTCGTAVALLSWLSRSLNNCGLNCTTCSVIQCRLHCLISVIFLASSPSKRSLPSLHPAPPLLSHDAHLRLPALPAPMPRLRL
jgi:hypothetical protein